ncbi:hypothetical protein PAPHI01_2285 [Pancytospora philotis]|nr:hypothetical protein PAPHI01_2285 [Pancytospora philotis]
MLTKLLILVVITMQVFTVIILYRNNPSSVTIGGSDSDKGDGSNAIATPDTASSVVGGPDDKKDAGEAAGNTPPPASGAQPPASPDQQKSKDQHPPQPPKDQHPPPQPPKDQNAPPQPESKLASETSGLTGPSDLGSRLAHKPPQPNAAWSQSSGLFARDFAESPIIDKVR